MHVGEGGLANVHVSDSAIHGGGGGGSPNATTDAVLSSYLSQLPAEPRHLPAASDVSDFTLDVARAKLGHRVLRDLLRKLCSVSLVLLDVRLNNFKWS